MTAGARRIFHIKPGEWVQCERLLGTFNAPADDLPSCRIQQSIPFNADEIGIAKNVILEQGISGRTDLDGFLSVERAIIRPKKEGMPMSCEHDGKILRCFL